MARERQQQINVVVKTMNLEVRTVVIGLTLEVHANLVRAAGEGGTPVDTGWARANWVPGIATPFQGTVGTRQEAKQSGANEAVAQSGLGTVAATYTLEKGSVFISNNVPYIGELNAGTSDKAPAGFVERAAIEAVEDGLRRGFRRRAA